MIPNAQRTGTASRTTSDREEPAMNLKTVSWLLIWTGAVLLVYGFFMGTTVETVYGEVVNLHLASRKQTLLIVGGVLLICGVLLYGFRKLKQTAEDEAQ